MAVAVQEEETRKGPSLIVQAAALLVVTALAAGMGWYTGGYLEARYAQQEKPDDADQSPGNKRPAEHASGEAAASSNVVTLDPITTNLADPSDVWVRLELAVVLESGADPALAQEIHQDLFAFMRTVKLKQIESASGFQHLKADLLERARIRSEGRVEKVLFMTFLYE